MSAANIHDVVRTEVYVLYVTASLFYTPQPAQHSSTGIHYKAQV